MVNLRNTRGASTEKGLVSIAVLAAIIFVAFITVFIFSYIALVNVKNSGYYAIAREEYKQKILDSVNAFFIVNETGNFLNVTVTSQYRFNIVLYVFIYRSGLSLSSSIVRCSECSSSCIVNVGNQYYIVYPPPSIPINEIIGLKIVADNGVVIPIPRRL